ncbi:hypothetical protein [Mycobacterium sp. C31M]
MRPAPIRLSPARFTGWVALIPLIYFAAEWVVAASWRGLYGYRNDLVGPLGIAFCGPVGNWPCSELYRAMNVALGVSGLAISVVAVCLLVQRVADRGSALLLSVAGIGLAVSGVITQNTSYAWNVTATMVFMTCGSVAALLVAVGARARMTVERRIIAVGAGCVSLFGFFTYVGSLDIVGPGAAQRLCIYGILVVVTVVGTAGFAGPQDTEPEVDTRELVEESR